MYTEKIINGQVVRCYVIGGYNNQDQTRSYNSSTTVRLPEQSNDDSWIIGLVAVLISFF